MISAATAETATTAAMAATAATAATSAFSEFRFRASPVAEEENFLIINFQFFVCFLFVVEIYNIYIMCFHVSVTQATPRMQCYSIRLAKDAPICQLRL